MKTKMGRRHQVLEILRTAPEPRTVSQIARKLRVHGNTVRFHLDSLLSDGLIEIEESNDGERPVGRPAIRYRAVARVVPSQMRHTETLVRLFLGDLEADPDGLERAKAIGRKWGSDQAKELEVGRTPRGLDRDVHRLNTLLNDMGFESDKPSAQQICVKACPFLDDVKARDIEEVGTVDLHPVCAVHLGVMKGALEEWGADLEVTNLVPFARVDRCTINLSRRPARLG